MKSGNYKNIFHRYFRTLYQQQLCTVVNSELNYENFGKVFMKIVNKHAPMKEKILQLP